MRYLRVPINGDAVVVAFDMCSSSEIIEDLTLRGGLRRLEEFLTTLKKYLASAQRSVRFDPYKFTGDGWILLFPTEFEGQALEGQRLTEFLRELCVFFKSEFQNHIGRHLSTPPAITGVTFGVERGPLASMRVFGQQEYVGWALDVACRLQGAVKDKGGSPAYKALVSNTVFNEYFGSIPSQQVRNTKRTLRNIRGGAEFRCRKIDLLGSGWA